MFTRLLFFPLVIKLTLSAYQDCGYHFSNKNVTFDISALTLTEQSSLNYYNVTSGDYHYLFNFCADVMSPPSICVFNDKQSQDEVYINGSLHNRANNVSSDIFQYKENYCYRLSGSSSMEPIIKNTLIDYELIDENDPSFGFILHYYYGDYCDYVWSRGGYVNRESKIAFVCDANINNIPTENVMVTEPETCVYEIEIKTSYGCPLECGRDINGNLCSNNGICGYDYDINTARCYCFAGFEGHYCNESVPFYGDIAWYNAIQPSNDSLYIYTFETIYGYNITYDLQYIIDGYINDKYYLLNDMNSTNYFYINLFDSFNTIINSLPICKQNDMSYDYGYIFQTIPNAPNAMCNSLGRSAPEIQLYDETLPTKGIKLSYSNGDNIGSGSCVNGTKTNIYFICPDSNKHERFDTMYGLNNIFNQFEFVTDETGCVYNIEIFTSSACPFQCMTYDDTNDVLSQCNAAGVCVYDFSLDITRCICEDLEVTKPEHIQCYDNNITYSPTNKPTLSPTIDPNIDIQWYKDVKISDTSNYIYTFNTIYGYNVTYDLQYIINGYFNGKYYELQDGSNSQSYYFNLFNKTYATRDTLKGICDNNVPDYNYGYVFQAESNSLDKCFSLGQMTSGIELYDVNDPTTGVSITFTGGDNHHCSDNKRRSMKINFICPSDGGIFERYDKDGSLNDIYSQYKVYEPQTCEYEVDIITSAACPSQCITYNSEKNAVSLCTTNGICDYDNTFKLIRCFCNNNMQISSEDDIFCANDNITYSPTPEPTNSPSKQPTQSPTNNPTLPPYITWIDDIKLNNKSDYIYTFQTNFGYNITYDLYYFIQGYLNNKYYKLSDNMEHNIYFNLFNSTIINSHPNVIGICDVNENDYDFGYIYQSHQNDPNVECRSIGRDAPNIQLYDENNPIKGMKLSYENGDSMGCTNGRRTDINLICPDDASEFEIYRDGSLNDIFSQYKFFEPLTCEYEIDIYTSSACPIQCMTYDENKPSISQCFTNGYCSDNSGIVRCICNDNMIINDPSDIFCKHESITHNPTEIPTINPTIYPTNTPTNTPTQKEIETYSLYGQWTRYDKELELLLVFEIGIDDICENIKFTFITPAASCYENMWFSIGIGGEYDIESSDDSVESVNKMNGYALVNFVGEVPKGYNQTYESTLEQGVIPKMQSIQDLRDCIVTIENCMQTTVCFRDYETENNNNFYQFIEGLNPIIYAFGELDSNYGYLPMKHIDSSDSFIELTGTAQCGYAKIINDEINKGGGGGGTKKDKNDHIWNILAIVFIVLFLLTVILCCIYWNKNHKGHYHWNSSHGRVQSHDAFDNTQMTSMDDDDKISPKGDTTKLITTKGNDDDDLL